MKRKFVLYWVRFQSSYAYKKELGQIKYITYISFRSYNSLSFHVMVGKFSQIALFLCIFLNYQQLFANF